LISPLSITEAANGINLIENNYESYSEKARARAEWIQDRQVIELDKFSEFIKNVRKPTDRMTRQNAVARASRINH
jgi:hypothetical protein